MRGGASLKGKGGRVGFRKIPLFKGKEGRGDFRRIGRVVRKILFYGKGGRVGFRKNSLNSFSNLRNQLPSMGNNPNIAIGMFPQKRFYDRSE